MSWRAPSTFSRAERERREAICAFLAAHGQWCGSKLIAAETGIAIGHVRKALAGLWRTGEVERRQLTASLASIEYRRD